MSIQGSIAKLGMSAAAAGIMAATAVAATTVSASAATQAIGTGRAQLCAQGNYSARFVFSLDIPGTSTQPGPWVHPGSCTTFTVPGSFGEATVVTVQGLFNTSNNTFNIGNSFFSGVNQPGVKIGAEGTTGNGGRDAFYMFFPNN